MWGQIVLFLLVLYFGQMSNAACLLQPRYVPLGLNGLHGVGQIYLIPIGTFPLDVVKRLVEFYRIKYELDVIVLSSPQPEMIAPAFNADRNQYIAEEIVRVLDQATVTLQPDATVIALTDQDLYIRESNWRYAFGYWSDQTAVISSARMDARFMAVWTIDQGWKETRLRKMVTKYIGVLHYHLPMSTHCRSPVYGQIGGPQELDFMGEDL